jgi:hypothetical protein
MDGNGPDPTLTVNGGRPVGDCAVAAMPAHANMITAVMAGLALAENSMTSNEVVTLYFALPPPVTGSRPPDWTSASTLGTGCCGSSIRDLSRDS